MDIANFTLTVKCIFVQELYNSCKVISLLERPTYNEFQEVTK